MNDKKKLLKAIKYARKINEAISLKLDKNILVSPSQDNVDKLINEYYKIIFAYLSIIIEHHRSIIELTNVRQLSALALVRPLYESYIRTVWLTSCFSEKTIKASIQLFHEIEDGKFPTLRAMCEDIDKIFNIGASRENLNAYTRELELNKKLLHSYTHGGAELIGIVNNYHHYSYTYQHMISIIKLINECLLTATYIYFDTTGNFALADLIEQMKMRNQNL